MLLAIDISGLTSYVANGIYFVLAAIALWGAYCVVMVWMRVAQKRFRDEAEQNEFLDQLEKLLVSQNFDAAIHSLDEDLRATPQLAQIAIRNRALGFTRVRQLVMDRFQRDVLTDLEHRLSWVHTVIKSAPMVGLLGTVIGMMGAFAKLAGTENVSPTDLAENISVALITTACGLAIAIPLVICTNSINIRIGKMEDLVGAGLTRFFETFRGVMSSAASPETPAAVEPVQQPVSTKE